MAKFSDDLPSLAIRRPILIVVIQLLIIIAGLGAIIGVEVRELPDIDRPVVTVRATYDGASPETVDTEVASVLEDAAARVPGVLSIRTSSEENNSRMRVEFSPEVDLNQAAADVREAVSGVLRRLPDGVEDVVVVKADADSDAIIRLAVVSDTLTEDELTRLADEDIATELAAVDGVAEVRLFGSREKVLRVVVDPLRLASYGLAVDAVARTLENARFDVPAGSFKSDDLMLIVRADASVWQPEEVADLVIRDVVQIGDVADVFYGPANAESYVQLDGRRVVGLGVVRQAQSNTISISNGISKAVERLNKRLDHVELVKISDDATFIRGSIREVLVSLGLAVMIVIAIIFLFIGRIRPTLIPATTIPVALIGTVAAIWLLGFSINILTLLALVLATGLIVDDAIVVLENIQRRRGQGLPPYAAAVLGTRQVFFAIIATTATLISVFIPISFLPSSAGRLFTEFGFVLAVAVAISSFVALTLCPMLASRLPREQSKHMGDGVSGTAQLARPIANLYGKLLAKALAAPLVVIGICLLAGGSSYWAFTQLDEELVPKEDRGVILVRGAGPDGVGLEYTARQAEQIEEILAPLRRSGELERLMTIVGLYDMHRTYTLAPLRPWAERERTQQEIAAELRQPLDSIPGINVRIVTPNSLDLSSNAGGLEVAITGNDYTELAAVGDRMVAEIQQRLPRLEDVRLSYQATQPEVSVKIDRRRAADLGIDVEAVATTLRAMVDGYEVTEISVNDEAVPVILSSAAGKIDGPEDLRNLFVATETGRTIPLSSIVTLTERSVASELDRHGQKRAVEIDAALAPGYSLGEAVADVQELADEMLPSSMALMLLGEARNLEETSHDVALTFGIAILVVLLVLAAQFESFLSALVVIVTVPFGVSAAVVALHLTGTTLNIYSQIGLIMLVGLMAKNGILIVEFADQLRDRGRNVRDAVYEATMVRLRPVMMTMLSTVLGGLPLILGSGPGAEARAAIGWVVFGGLGIATLYTLFLTPVAYLILAGFAKPRAHGTERLERELDEAEDSEARPGPQRPRPVSVADDDAVEPIRAAGE